MDMHFKKRRTVRKKKIMPIKKVAEEPLTFDQEMKASTSFIKKLCVANTWNVYQIGLKS